MAAITPTIEEVRSGGDHSVITGTVVVPNTSANEFAVVGTNGHVIACSVENTTAADADVRVAINVEDDYSTAKQGTVAITSSAADTYRFVAQAIP